MLKVEQILEGNYTHYTGGKDRSEKSYWQKVGYVLDNYENLWLKKLMDETGLYYNQIHNLEKEYNFKVRELTLEEQNTIKQIGINKVSKLSDDDKQFIKQFYKENTPGEIARTLNKREDIIKNYIKKLDNNISKKTYKKSSRLSERDKKYLDKFGSRLTVSELSKRLNVEYKAIHGYLKSKNILPLISTIRPKRKELIKKYYNMGYTTVEALSPKVGITIDTLEKYLSELKNSPKPKQPEQKSDYILQPTIQESSIQSIIEQEIAKESLVPETETMSSGLSEKYYNMLLNLNNALGKIVDYSNKGRKISKETLFYILEENGLELMVSNIYKYVLKENDK